MWSVVIQIALMALLCALPLGAKAELYRWIDEEGIRHYTTDPERIPRAVSASLVVREAPQAPELRTGRNTAEQAPPLREPLREADADRPADKIEPLPHPATPGDEALAPTATRPDSLAKPSARAAPKLPPIETGLETPRANPVPIDPPIDPGTTGDLSLEELEDLVERDRDELRRLIGEREWQGSELAKDVRLRELADRLPRMQARLERLRRSANP